MNRSGLPQQVFDNRDLKHVGPAATPTRCPPSALPVFLWQGHGLHPHQLRVKLRLLLQNRLHPELLAPDRAYGLRCNLRLLHGKVRFVTCPCASRTTPLRGTVSRVRKLQSSYREYNFCHTAEQILLTCITLRLRDGGSGRLLFGWPCSGSRRFTPPASNALQELSTGGRRALCRGGSTSEFGASNCFL